MKRISEVIEISGLSRRTLQYYDDAGLLTVSRSAENYRLYGDEDLRRLWEILVYKEMGFHLDEIRVMLDEDECSVRIMLDIKKRKIEEKISEMNQMCRLIGWVRDRGIPDYGLISLTEKNTTYAEMAKLLSENPDL